MTHATRSDRPFRHDGSRDASDVLEQRLASLIAAYDGQGNHRTGTDADHASALWLADAARRLGIDAVLEPFGLDRVDPQACYLRVADRCIDGVPVFDAAFTGSDGVRGRLGPLGSDGEIAVVESEPFTLHEPRKEQGGAVARARRSRHQAVVVLTRGSRPGLFLINALSFANPCGPPMLQVSSTETAWLKQQADAGAAATLVNQAGRTASRAFNVTARIAGRDPDLPPLVVMTSRSGWWQCASERGGGLACWLEAMRVLAAAQPARDCLFVACSGHELGFIGIDAYLASRPDLIRHAHCWVQFGANIGAPHQKSLVHASDDAAEQWAVAALALEGLRVGARAARESAPRGEAGTVHRGGGRYVALVCGTDVFHHAADRFPDAVDASLVARYARALASGVLQLAARNE